MAGKLTIPINDSQYEKVISAFINGIPKVVKPNYKIALALQVEANTGIRIGDVLDLKLNDFIMVDGKWRFNMVEQKTKKKRMFFVQDEVMNLLLEYCKENKISWDEAIIGISVRYVQKELSKVCIYYNYKWISTHSFRKRFATRVYEASDFDLELTRRLMQHSSAAITAKYLGIQDAKIEKVLKEIMMVFSKDTV